MKRVLLDCDGILSDFVGGALPIMSRILGREVKREEITKFKLAESLGFTREQDEELITAIDTTPGWCESLDLYPVAREGYALLAESCDVYIVTSPWNSRPTWVHERENWLRHHLGIPPGLVVHTSAKHLVTGDVLVDDKTSTLVKWQAAHPNGLAIQWATPHNRLDAWNGPSTCSWTELCALIHRGVNEEQPAPIATSRRPTWELVAADYTERELADGGEIGDLAAKILDDMKERDAIGAAKYGVRHTSHNGRDHLVDAYQELLDHVLYLRAWLEEHPLDKITTRDGRSAHGDIDRMYRRGLDGLWWVRGAMEPTKRLIREPSYGTMSEWRENSRS